ncbi:MAG: class IV adenylate cyclase [Planctomycetota bacterium]
MLEVELKFPIAAAGPLQARLDGFGAVSGDAVTQSDAYYNHPSRDFAVTDEALRIRTVVDPDGQDESRITYKGPKQGTLAKTRFEIELPLAEQTAEGWADVLTKLGFRHVATVTKRRAVYILERTGRRFEVSVDEVDRLGTFAEVETLAEPADREAAEQAVQELAADLGLTTVESRSYLELLLNVG